MKFFPSLQKALVCLQWLHITNIRSTNQNANGIIEIEADPNNKSDGKTGIIIVSATGLNPVEITVTRKAAGEAFNYKPNEMNRELATKCAEYAMLAYESFCIQRV